MPDPILTEQHILELPGPPSAPPPHLAMHYVNTTTGEVYVSGGTEATSDWGIPVNRRKPPNVIITNIIAPQGHTGQYIYAIKAADEYLRINSVYFDYALFIDRQSNEPFERGRVLIIKHVFGDSNKGLSVAALPGTESVITFNVYLPLDGSILPGVKDKFYIMPGGAVSLTYIGLNIFGQEEWDVDGDYFVEGLNEPVA